jgi:hypothetical protein
MLATGLRIGEASAVSPDALDLGSDQPGPAATTVSTKYSNPEPLTRPGHCSSKTGSHPGSGVPIG